MKTKVQRFLDQVVRVSQRSSIKSVIHDSVENNRTVSVEQLVRYNRQSVIGNWNFAADLRQVKKYLLREKLLQRVRRGNSRTDAYDVTEFVTAIRLYVLTSETRRKELNKIVSSY